ncbi:MAG: hypothetical protein ACTSVY_10750 [Candidatus Helarchaeota archaeon]
MFHHVFIVEKTGICIFHKCFDECSDNINKDLFSGFFSALFDFSKEMFSEDYYDFIDLIDFGEKRFIIVETPKLFFIGLIDSKDSTIAAIKQLKRFKNSFVYKFRNVLSNWVGKIDDFQGTEELLDKIQKIDSFRYLDPKLLKGLNDTLSEIKAKNSELNAIGVLSMTGVPQININLSNDYLTAIVKEIELRWRAQIENIHKVIFIFGNDELIMIQNIKNKIILAVVFKVGVPLGMADMLMEEIIEKIKKNFNLKSLI